jgi:16S rRNA (cytosine967-C5)-methyltransferase
LRIAEQSQVLDRAAKLVRPGGRIIYITCSLLPAENDAAVAGLLSRWRGRFDAVPAETVLAAGPPSLAASVRHTEHGLQMTPLRTGTDGFYVSVITRRD